MADVDWNALTPEQQRQMKHALVDQPMKLWNMAGPHVTDHRRLLSRPWPVEWQGWRSFTSDLQRAGWDIAVETDRHRFPRGETSLILRHRNMKMVAITRSIEIDAYSMTDPSFPDNQLPPFEVVHCAPSILRERFAPINASVVTDASLELMNATPMMAYVEDLGSLEVFRKADESRTVEEVLIDRADMTVVEHLEAIKTLQSPRQKELRDKAREQAEREPEAMPERSVVAVMANYR